jgi:hypothetical protein
MLVDIVGFNNVTCMCNLNLNGALKCKSQNFDSNATYLLSLNVSGFTSLNNNVAILSALNVSGLSTLSNNTTLLCVHYYQHEIYLDLQRSTIILQ